jgi:hypothetical protein
MKDHIFAYCLNNIDNEVYCDFIVMLTSFQTISSINYGLTAIFPSTGYDLIGKGIHGSVMTSVKTWTQSKILFETPSSYELDLENSIVHLGSKQLFHFGKYIYFFSILGSIS